MCAVYISGGITYRQYIRVGAWVLSDAYRQYIKRQVWGGLLQVTYIYQEGSNIDITSRLGFVVCDVVSIKTDCSLQITRLPTSPEGWTPMTVHSAAVCIW